MTLIESLQIRVLVSAVTTYMTALGVVRGMGGRLAGRGDIRVLRCS